MYYNTIKNITRSKGLLGPSQGHFRGAPNTQIPPPEPVLRLQGTRGRAHRLASSTTDD